MKITKEEFYKLYSDTVTKKEYDEIISKIDKRFSEICLKIIPRNHRSWFDYGNAHEEKGYFDPHEYNSFINVISEYSHLPEPYYSNPFKNKTINGINGFPTRWLWEDFEGEFNARVAEYEEKETQAKIKAKNRREDLKARKAEMKKIISSKLTKEELKYIKFK